MFDEFHEPEGQGPYGGMELGSPLYNTLLRVLDGQPCQLDSKYSRVFTKTKNVPIVMIANVLPRCMKGPFQERLTLLQFRKKLMNLKQERVVLTLWGCMVRRIMNSAFADSRMIDDVHLNYNEEEGQMAAQYPETESQYSHEIDCDQRLIGDKFKPITQLKGFHLSYKQDKVNVDNITYITIGGICYDEDKTSNMKKMSILQYQVNQRKKRVIRKHGEQLVGI